jgi:uncharacterized membrane protein
MKKLLAFRITIIAFIIISFISSFKLETEAECVIMFFTFLLSLGYLGAEMIVKRDDEAKQ